MPQSIKYIFRMTHIQNIPHILDVGFVHGDSPKSSSNYIPIGDSSMIRARAEKDAAGRPLGQYIPFYFGPRSPMLYVIQNGFNGVTKRSPGEIVYCVIRINTVINSKLRFIFTDGHAADHITTTYQGEALKDIDSILSYDDVYAQFWNEDADAKRKKEAELLFLDEVPASLISGYVVYDEEAKQQLISYGIPEDKIIIRTTFYF